MPTQAENVLFSLLMEKCTYKNKGCERAQMTDVHIQVYSRCQIKTVSLVWAPKLEAFAFIFSLWLKHKIKNIFFFVILS